MEASPCAVQQPPQKTRREKADGRVGEHASPSPANAGSPSVPSASREARPPRRPDGDRLHARRRRRGGEVGRGIGAIGKTGGVAAPALVERDVPPPRPLYPAHVSRPSHDRLTASHGRSAKKARTPRLWFMS